MKREKIVMFGSYVADLTGVAEHLPVAGETVFGEKFKIGPGGKGSNQAVAAHRAGADIRVVSKLGRDVFGDLALDFYKEDGISTESILIDEEKGTGIALICVDSVTGQNQILVVPAACTNFTSENMKQIDVWIREADILLMQFEINMDALEHAAAEAKNAGVKVIINPAPARKVSEGLLKMIDVITPNEVEAETLTGIAVHDQESAGRSAQMFHTWGIPEVVITMGKSGVYVSNGKREKMIAARKVECIDTTGAGDAFNGGLVTALSEGKDIFEAAEFGNALASLSVQRFGTAPSMPLRGEIDKVLAK